MRREEEIPRGWGGRDFVAFDFRLLLLGENFLLLSAGVGSLLARKVARRHLGGGRRAVLTTRTSFGVLSAFGLSSSSGVAHSLPPGNAAKVGGQSAHHHNPAPFTCMSMRATVVVRVFVF